MLCAGQSNPKDEHHTQSTLCFKIGRGRMAGFKDCQSFTVQMNAKLVYISKIKMKDSKEYCIILTSGLQGIC